MPPIHMTASERSALARLSRAPLSINDIPPDHAQKFMNHGLAVQQVIRLKITPKGQLEVLRQRYRRLTTRTAHVTEEDFRTRLERRLQERLAGPLADRESQPSDTEG